MCNDYRLMVDLASIIEDFAHLKIKIRFGEGAPNVEAREDIKITDMAPIIRGIEGARDEADLVQRRWSCRARTSGRSTISARTDASSTPIGAFTCGDQHLPAPNEWSAFSFLVNDGRGDSG